MTKSEKTQLSLDFSEKDKAEAIDHEFSGCGAIYLTDAAGNYASISFHPEHIPAIEQLLNILYFHRGDYADVVHPHVIERLEAAV
jgi:hypothetical protein